MGSVVQPGRERRVEGAQDRQKVIACQDAVCFHQKQRSHANKACVFDHGIVKFKRRMSRLQGVGRAYLRQVNALDLPMGAARVMITCESTMSSAHSQA